MTREELITETVDAVAQGQSPGDTGDPKASHLQEQLQATNPLEDLEYINSLRQNSL